MIPDNDINGLVVFNRLQKALDREDKETIIASIEKDTKKVLVRPYPELLKVYALACLYVDEVNNAYDALKNLTGSEEVRSLIAFQLGKYSSVVACMGKTNAKSRAGRVALAVSMYNTGSKPSKCLPVLDDILEKSIVASTVAGVMHFNSQDYQSAQECFLRVIIALPGNSFAWDCLMTTRYASGENGNSFQTLEDSLKTTGCIPEETIAKMKRKRLYFPEMKLGKRLYKIAEKLIT